MIQGPANVRSQAFHAAWEPDRTHNTFDILSDRKDGSAFVNRFRIRPIYGPEGQLMFFAGAQNPVQALRRPGSGTGEAQDYKSGADDVGNGDENRRGMQCLEPTLGTAIRRPIDRRHQYLPREEGRHRNGGQDA